MKLSNAKVIKQLVAEASAPTRSAAQPLQVARRSITRQCICGHCPLCLDNARWDRIFQEKLVDPTYYRWRAVTHGSALNDF